YLKQNDGKNIAVYGTQWRKFYYPNPIPNHFYSGNTVSEGYGIGLPENYYAFTWGDALFVVLDVYRHCDVNEKPQTWDWTLGEEQYQWFRRTLAGSDARYKFVFAHHVRGQGRGAVTMAKFNEWGGYNNKNVWQFNTERPGWEAPIHQLMVKYGVNIFFQGHDHLYAWEQLDGIVYQETPMAADSTYQIGVLANADAYTDVTRDGTGHLRVQVNTDSVTVDFVRAYLPADTQSGTRKNGEIAHRYTIRQRLSSVENSTDNALPRCHAMYQAGMNTLYVTLSRPLPVSAHVEVVTLQGKIVLQTDIEQGSWGTVTGAGTLPSGFYMVRIVLENGSTIPVALHVLR
ncbi:MAG: hypothetical protein JNL32_08270, partial [Candidatus Kapabacteria bacterium]|nr:hypothetical protein [Candidatus Kapabacteria bacterium]